MNIDQATVAFQGELGAYSELAARAFFEEVNVLPQATFKAVFEAVQDGACSHGIVPIENSLTGSIHQNYDLLLEHQLWIVGEIKLRITHHLITHPGVTLKDITRVYSHPQALSQCQDFLRGLQDVEAISVYDTAGAVRLIRDKGWRDAGAIASAQAAVDYGMAIIDSGIESNHENFTRFLFVAREPRQGNRDPKTSIVFSTKNIPGALFKSLSVFAQRDIDLMKIESRPLRGSPWQYLFYLDFEGDMEEERCQRAIGHLREIATFLRILGSHDKGKEVDGRVHQR